MLREICFCIGHWKELSDLTDDIELLATSGKSVTVVLDKGMSEPKYLGEHAKIHCDIHKNLPIVANWKADVLVVTHQSKIGRHLVEHWKLPEVKFLYMGVYSNAKDWLPLHGHIHTVWGLMEQCVKEWDQSLAPWIVAGSTQHELSPGRRLLDLMS